MPIPPAFPARALAGLLCLSLSALAVPAQAATLCTAVADAATGQVLLQQGRCTERFTPASTFKIPLAVMGYDAGFLKDAHAPVLPYVKGYVDWGGEAWRQATDPSRWMQYSVVWYSQRIAHALQAPRLSRYAQAFGYGNADFGGDPGRGNGLERAWIASSLQVSPLEQLTFLGRLVRRELPVQPAAMDAAAALLETVDLADGWQVRGKTGSAFPRDADGRLDEEHGWGWYVGWARQGSRTLVFVRLTQDEAHQAVGTGPRTRDAWMQGWPALARQLPAAAATVSVPAPASTAR